MASNMIAHTKQRNGVSLRGASEKMEGVLKNVKKRAFHINIDAPPQVCTDLVKATDGNTNSKIVLGRDSKIKFGRHEGKISLTTEDYRTELFANENPGLAFDGRVMKPAQAKDVNQAPTVQDIALQMSPNEHSGLAFSGRVTHTAQVKNMWLPPTPDDPATQQLLSQLAAHEKEKSSNQSKFVEDLPLPKKKGGPGPKPNGIGPKASVAGPKAKGPATWLQKEKAKVIKAKARQQEQLLAVAPAALVPSRPALPSSRPPTTVTAVHHQTAVTVHVDEKVFRMQSLRTPFIHLLAADPMSARELARKMFCTREECQELLAKIGRQRGPGDKWFLNDRVYKELDVWKFPFLEAEDRERAVSNAISAFDRLRLSRLESAWQLLLPEGDRGKGIVLSRLNLHHGAVVRSSPVRAPGGSAPSSGVPTKRGADSIDPREDDYADLFEDETTTRPQKRRQHASPLASPKRRRLGRGDETAPKGGAVPATAEKTAMRSTGMKRKAVEGAELATSVKRQQTGVASTRSLASASVRASASHRPAISPVRGLVSSEIGLRTVLLAKEYKESFATYVAKYRQVAGMAQPSAKAVAEVRRRHRDLAAKRAAIVEASASL